MSVQIPSSPASNSGRRRRHVLTALGENTPGVPYSGGRGALIREVEAIVVGRIGQPPPQTMRGVCIA